MSSELVSLHMEGMLLLPTISRNWLALGGAVPHVSASPQMSRHQHKKACVTQLSAGSPTLQACRPHMSCLVGHVFQIFQFKCLGLCVSIIPLAAGLNIPHCLIAGHSHSYVICQLHSLYPDLLFPCAGSMGWVTFSSVTWQSFIALPIHSADLPGFP